MSSSEVTICYFNQCSDKQVLDFLSSILHYKRALPLSNQFCTYFSIIASAKNCSYMRSKIYELCNSTLPYQKSVESLLIYDGKLYLMTNVTEFSLVIDFIITNTYDNISLLHHSTDSNLTDPTLNT